jgi:hypothetical protein
MVRQTCKAWSCKYCGHVKRKQLQSKIKAARPNRFVTLTTCGHATETPRQIFDWSRRQISELGKVIRKENSEFEYLRCLEATKTGYPHYHLLCRSGWLDQKRLSELWCKFTRAYIVDIRALSKDENAAKYVMKYLGKQTSLSFTKRRLSWTRRFFPPAEKPKPSASIPAEIKFYNGSMEDVSYWELPGTQFEKPNAWHWIAKRSF